MNWLTAIPVYNEERHLEALQASLLAVCQQNDKNVLVMRFIVIRA